MTRTLVLGGTGHIGSAIARLLDQSGHDVVASGRTHKPRPNLDDTNIQIVCGDDHDTSVLSQWMQNMDVVVDAATPYPLALYETDTRYSIARARTRIRAVLNQVRQLDLTLIHISSFTTLPVSGGLKSQLLHGTIRGLHPYFELKEVVETEAIRAIRSGMKGSILNPAACFGPYDLKPKQNALIPMLLAGKVAGSVGHAINVIDVRDVAKCVLSALNHTHKFERIPVFGHNISVDGLMKRVCKFGGVKSPSFRTPTLFGVAGLYWMEAAFAVAGKSSPWPSLPLLLVSAGKEEAQSPEQLALGITPRALDDTIEESVQWYLNISED